ncbi:MAG: 2-hydroxyacyl-CoA dehydratase family protein [Candidatus Helarchaeota archaeon]
MSKLVSDYLNTSLLNFTIDYYSGKKHIQRGKRAGKKICSMMLPFGIELVNASDCIPVSLFRVGNFKVDSELRLVRVANSIFGISNVTRTLSLLYRTTKGGANYLANFSENLLNSLWDNYKNFIRTSADELYPLDACFGTRLHHGATVNWKDKIDFSFGIGLRCIWLSKHFKITNEIKPLIFMDIPTIPDEISKVYFLEEIKNTLEKLEKFTGKSISEINIQKQIKISNKIRKEYLNILKIWSNHSNTISPQSFIYLLSMIHFGFTDHLSNPERFLNLLKALNRDLQKISEIRKNNHEMPKLMMFPMFGGFEPEIMKIVSNAGGRLCFIDWDILGLLKPIKETGNLLENYANFLLNFAGVFMNNDILTENALDAVRSYNLNGVIFNSVYGCKSLTPASRILKDKLRNIDVPMLDLSFQNLDENIGQFKTRIGAFIEMINS